MNVTARLCRARCSVLKINGSQWHTVYKIASALLHTRQRFVICSLLKQDVQVTCLFAYTSRHAYKKKDSYAIAVGERLADARREAIPPISQKDAAEYLSKRLNKRVSHTTISNYESGSRLPTPPIVDVLCRFYGTLPATYVLGLVSIRTAQIALKYEAARAKKEKGQLIAALYGCSIDRFPKQPIDRRGRD
ncbi:helix-turn-helix domain-containing protein [Xylella fastidiosa]|uniref:helix-turn-helix domain-containing protein n=1 Tax=Xylella fastidiosa TaxID=2371 RepID=UPI002367F32C|nr:helix-turn-helix transcriptional regulator [Xylella fastidiosa]WDN62958.1 helix-turn-helix domain-containing protein [Xylella fastidiosa subsp. multiplex]